MFLLPHNETHPLQLSPPYYCTQTHTHTHVCALSQVWATTDLLCVFMDLAVLNSLCNWNHTTCGLLWLAPCTSHVFQFHPRCSICQCFSPFYGQIVIHCMAMTHFLHLLIIVGDLVSFHLLTFINNVAVNICMQDFVRPCFHFGWVYIYPGVGSLESRGNSVFTFLRNDQTVFSQVAAPFHIPTSSVGAFQYLHIFGNTYYQAF